MAKVLVLKRRPDGGHVGFWAEFEGEKVSSYEDTRGDNNIVYTLYRCTAYQGEAYRVHIANESDPGEPDYMLHPVRWDTRSGGGRPDFSEVWNREDIAEKFPLFLKDIGLPRNPACGPKLAVKLRQARYKLGAGDRAGAGTRMRPPP